MSWWYLEFWVDIHLAGFLSSADIFQNQPFFKNYFRILSESQHILTCLQRLSEDDTSRQNVIFTRPLGKSAFKNYFSLFLIQNIMLWVLKRTISMR